ncbi:MAG: hypothetical protein LBL65_05560 [Campylobacteraceae bacterium]|jgi:hypothetical protein|nr:hypothetical protein [Campylobacteraceae bacterium]
MARVLSKVGIRITKETVPGTYVTPTVVVKNEGIVIPQIEFDNPETPNFGFLSGTKDSITIADWGRGTFDIETSLTKTLAQFETLFAICNLKKAAITTPAAGFKFTPTTNMTDTASIDVLLPDRKFAFKGAKANLKLTANVGEIIKATFSASGSFDAQAIANQTLTMPSAEEFIVLHRATVTTLDGTALNVQSIEFDMGSTISYEKFTNIGEYHLADFDPKITLKVRLEAGAEDGFAKFQAGEALSFVATFIDGGGDDRWALKCPKLKLSSSPSYEDAEGIFVLSREFAARATSGDDNFSLEHYTV